MEQITQYIQSIMYLHKATYMHKSIPITLPYLSRIGNVKGAWPGGPVLVLL